jgi:hypothetical protein
MSTSVPTAYVSLSAFDTVFYNLEPLIMGMYTRKSLVHNANSENCPAGRVLTVVGMPANPCPGTIFTAVMYKVKDNVSGLSGYIDPKNPAFKMQ